MRAERLVELYEREAYRAYNLALRTTGEEEAAARATEQGFLRHVASGLPEGENEQALLDRATVATALNEAPRTPHLADDADPVSRAMAALPPSQRAIIALLSFDQAPEAIAAAMGAPPQTAQSFVAGARESLAAELQIDVDFVDQRLSEWAWTEPPTAIWESLYPQAHRLLAERETGATDAEQPRKTRKSSRSALAGRLVEGSPRLRRRFAGGFSGRGRIWAFRGAVLAIILVPAVAVALTSGKGDENVALSAPGAAAGGAAAAEGSSDSEDGTTYDALSPKELDQLRLQELDELRQASEQQDDESLSSGERSDAEARAQELLALARERMEAAEQREQQVEAQEQKPATQPAPQPVTGTIPVTGKKKKKRKKQQGTTPPPSGSIDECLFNPETGTYICPQ